ncbi:MAG: cell wall hydrolase [Oscillospiraceae bacterium]|jgi:N-acetylmuramoyl-L-alanine amidase|nr:cell wall hydrolase [Oscillospiraceae bacterium]
MKKLISICAALLILAGTPIAAGNASFELIDIYIDGSCYELDNPAFARDGVTYVPLREFCEIIGEEVTVSWNGQTRIINVTYPPVTITLDIDKPYIIANDRYLYIDGGAVIEDGTAYVPVRAIAKALGSTVHWNPADKTASVITGVSELKEGGKFYDPDEIYWLSHIISAEAKGEPIEGKIAVGNVVLNRVDHPSYPSTIREVILDTVGGYQFTPAATGSLYDEPTEESIIAAKLVLDGADTAGNSLFFQYSKISTSWLDRNCSYIMTIGNHDFYE